MKWMWPSRDNDSHQPCFRVIHLFSSIVCTWVCHGSVNVFSRLCTFITTTDGNVDLCVFSFISRSRMDCSCFSTKGVYICLPVHTQHISKQWQNTKAVLLSPFQNRVFCLSTQEDHRLLWNIKVANLKYAK